MQNSFPRQGSAGSLRNQKNQRTQSADRGNWILDYRDAKLKPAPGFVDLLQQWMFEREGDDPKIRFVFHESHQAADLYVHHSRIEFFGGPLTDYLRPRSENFDGTVRLPERDDPRSFGNIKRFLYGLEVDLNRKVDELIALVRVTHRWALMDFFQLVCSHLQERDMLLKQVAEIIAAADITELESVPESFIEYYWGCVGKRIDAFGKLSVVRSGDVQETGSISMETSSETTDSRNRSPGSQMCPRFPELWDMALRQGKITTLMFYASKNSTIATKEDLLKVVLLDLEPRIEEDCIVSKLLSVLSVRDLPLCDMILHEGHFDKEISARAMRLLANQLLCGLDGSWDFIPFVGPIRRLAQHMGSCLISQP